jgi:nucleoside-diphosphate-sugar epimerase
MKVFVTGGTGFIGSHFVQQAQAAGHDLLVLRRPGSQPRLPLKQEPTWLTKTMDQVSIEDLQGCRILVHLAAHSANYPYDGLSACLYWNVVEPCRLFEKAHAAGIEQFIVAGTGFEYGTSGERYECIPVDAPLEPTQSYPISKAAASIALMGFARERKVKLLLLRIFQVYGVGEAASRFWPSLRRAALAGEDFPMSEGRQVRDFTPVELVAARFVTALHQQGLVPGQPKIEHIGTGHPLTLLAFSEHWWQHWRACGRLLPGRVPYRPNEVMRFLPQL